MRLRPRRRPAALALTALAALLLAALLSACSGAGGTAEYPTRAPTPTPAPSPAPSPAVGLAGPGARPSSTARITILSPRNGQSVDRPAPEVRLGLRGATIASHSSTRVRPDQGHIHLLVDGRLVAMDYGLDQRLPRLTPGQHLLQVEFVAADHAPFDPRVLTQAAFRVTVRG